MIANINSPEALKEWLVGKPEELGRAIAARIAMRVLPLVTSDHKLPYHVRTRLVLCSFRAIAVARASLFHSEHVSFAACRAAVRAARAAVAEARDEYGSREAAAAARAAAFAPFGVAEVSAAEAIKASPDISGRLFEEIRTDCDFWSSEGGSSALLLSRINWSRAEPDKIRSAWEDEAWGEDPAKLYRRWSQWLIWHAFKLYTGAPEWGFSPEHDKEFTLRLLQANGEFWLKGETGPEFINDKLRDWFVESLPPDQSPEKPRVVKAKPGRKARQTEQRGEVDFFISYAGPDLAAAQEVIEVLQSAGFRTFVQFEDMPPGSNFVMEMDRGLSSAHAFIALYSNAYFQSKHCRAELAFAYNQDPDGETRFARALYLEPCQMPPLARQIVYQSLVGLSKKARRAKILELVNHVGGA